MTACASATAQRRESLPQQLRDLPLVELPAEGPSSTLALVMSGDGNWASFVSELADTLAGRGISVVGLESRAYLSRPKTPDQVAADMERVLRRYLDSWLADDVLLVGYSRGADFVPFLVNRLPEDLRARIRLVALLSPTRMASFEFHLTDLVKYTSRRTDVSTLDEMESLGTLRLMCIYGKDDRESLCPLLPPGSAEVLPRDTGHRLQRPGELARAIVTALEDAMDSRTPAKRDQNR